MRVFHQPLERLNKTHEESEMKELVTSGCFFNQVTLGISKLQKMCDSIKQLKRKTFKEVKEKASMTQKAGFVWIVLFSLYMMEATFFTNPLWQHPDGQIQKKKNWRQEDQAIAKSNYNPSHNVNKQKTEYEILRSKGNCKTGFTNYRQMLYHLWWVTIIKTTISWKI